MAREYFCAYHSFLEPLKLLSESECGRLFVACLEYSKSGATLELRGNEKFIFAMLKEQIDRDKQAYEKKSEQLRANASRSKQTEANASRSSQEEEKDKEEEDEEEEDLD